MPQYELNFRDYCRIIRKRKWVILLSLLTVIFSSFGYHRLQPEVYRATASIRVEERRTTPQLFMEMFYLAPSDPVANQERIVRSILIAEEAAVQLGMVKKEATPVELTRAAVTIQNMLSVKRVEESNLLLITATCSSPKDTVRIANAVTQLAVKKQEAEESKHSRMVRLHIEEQLNEVKEKLKRAYGDLKKFRAAGKGTGLAGPLAVKLVDLKFELSRLRRQYTDKHPRVMSLREETATIQKELETLLSEDIDIKPLLREIEVAESAYAMLDGKYREALISETREKVEVVIIVNLASEPHSSTAPNRKRIITMGGIIGLMLGFLFAFILESVDTSIGTVEDVESYLKIPVLGVIPHLPGGESIRFLRLQKKKPSKEVLRDLLVTHFQPNSILAEAYRKLRTNIQFARAGKEENTFLVTSTGPQEGKSITLANCGIAMAQMGLKTLLVESDLRRPTLHTLFGLKREPGLTDILVENVKWEEALRTVTDISLGELGVEDMLKTPGLENLSIITAGHRVLSPTELLASAELTKLIEDAKTKFDILLFDTSPVLPVTDASIMGAKVDGVILVYEAGRIARGALRRAKSQLDSAKAKVLGIVLNNILAGELKQFISGYYDYYYAEDEEAVARSRIKTIIARVSRFFLKLLGKKAR